jgi:uncharacterized protein (DUF2147 family)
MLETMKRHLSLLVMMTLANAATAAWAGGAAAAPRLEGFWMDSDGEVIIEVAACSSGRCAKVSWLKQPFGPDGTLLRDYKNSDPKLATRLVCGMDIISGFEKQTDGTWGGAKVYVPDLGMSFTGKAEVLSETQIKVTGFVVLPLFGSSEVWSRVAGPPTKCDGTPHKAATDAPAPAKGKPDAPRPNSAAAQR